MYAQALEVPMKISSDLRAKATPQSVRAGQVAAMLRDIEDILAKLQSKSCWSH